MLNNTAIRYILVAIKPDIKDADSRRARYLGHIINLAIVEAQPRHLT